MYRVARWPNPDQCSADAWLPREAVKIREALSDKIPLRTVRHFGYRTSAGRRASCSCCKTSPGQFRLNKFGHGLSGSQPPQSPKSPVTYAVGRRNSVGLHRAWYWQHLDSGGVRGIFDISITFTLHARWSADHTQRPGPRRAENDPFQAVRRPA